MTSRTWRPVSCRIEVALAGRASMVVIGHTCMHVTSSVPQLSPAGGGSLRFGAGARRCGMARFGSRVLGAFGRKRCRSRLFLWPVMVTHIWWLSPCWRHCCEPFNLPLFCSIYMWFLFPSLEALWKPTRFPITKIFPYSVQGDVRWLLPWWFR